MRHWPERLVPVPELFSSCSSLTGLLVALEKNPTGAKFSQWSQRVGTVLREKSKRGIIHTRERVSEGAAPEARPDRETLVFFRRERRIRGWNRDHQDTRPRGRRRERPHRGTRRLARRGFSPTRSFAARSVPSISSFRGFAPAFDSDDRPAGLARAISASPVAMIPSFSDNEIAFLICQLLLGLGVA